MPIKYPDEQIEYLLSLSGLQRKEMAERFNAKFGTHKNADTLASLCKRHGGRGGAKDYFTAEEDAWLEENRPRMFRDELADEFYKAFGKRRTANSLICRCHRNGIHCDDDGRFQKGNPSWHSGMSVEEYKSHFTEESFAKGKFKKGERSIAYKYDVGDEVVRDDYVYVKISDDPTAPASQQWRTKQRVVYEKYHGEVPEGHQITFIDGDKRNFSIDNLAAITDAERMCITANNWSGKGEITRTGIAYAKLKTAIKEAKKKRGDRQ